MSLSFEFVVVGPFCSAYNLLPFETFQLEAYILKKCKMDQNLTSRGFWIMQFAFSLEVLKKKKKFNAKPSSVSLKL